MEAVDCGGAMICTPSTTTAFAKIAWFLNAPETNFLQSTEWTN